MYRNVFPALILLLVSLLTACNQTKAPKQTKNVEYTICTQEDFPEELTSLINQRKDIPFQMSFCDKDYLYIVKGYGSQKTGGYSIKINHFYQTKDSLYLDTDLFGPKDNKNLDTRTSYPYIVLKTERINLPVEFAE